MWPEKIGYKSSQKEHLKKPDFAQNLGENSKELFHAARIVPPTHHRRLFEG
jgi:hypothetical protein